MGSSISAKGSASDAISHRLKCAWKAYTGMRPQLQVFGQPLRMRLQLLDAVVLPSLLWGLETLWLCRPERGRIRAFERTVVARCIRFFVRPSETREQFCRRRVRVTTKWIRVAMRGQWDQLQRYRFLNYYGHAMRLSDEHLLGEVSRWRSDAWWREYRSRHAKWGGAAGRRPADLGNALQNESHIQSMYQEYLRQPSGVGMLEVLGGHREMSSWGDLALHRGEYRKFAQWTAFTYDITDEGRPEQHGREGR